MNLKLIDSHCHVHFQAYKDDMDDVIIRTLAEGTGMITVGTQSTTSENAIKIAEQYNGVWATIGLHPNHLHQQEFYDQDELSPEEQGTDKIKTRSEQFDPDFYRSLVDHPKVVAVGEFGLDYYRLPPEVDREQMIDDQKTACREMLKFASVMNKPVVIHSREAFDDQLSLLLEEIKNGGLMKRGVIHSFTGTAVEARDYNEIGFAIGLNGILTFSKELQKEIKDIPLEQIIIETDAPYLAPPPYRGKRNEPGYVKYVAEKIAEIKGISFDEVAETTTTNTIRLFNLSSW
ncbi:MAG: TatD family hydrolase [Patescibacteria group bacterium]